LERASRWTVVVISGAVLLAICILTVIAGGFRPEVAVADGTLTPWAYLPYVSKAMPLGVHVLSNHSHYVSGSSLYIVGEVCNNTGNNLSLVKVVANLFTSNGQLIDTDYTYVNQDTLPSRGKACFSIWVHDPPDDWAYYEFESPTYYTTDRDLPNLTVFNHSASYQPDDEYKIVGMIRNDRSSYVGYAQAIATLYDASGKVAGCRSTYVNSTHLESGQTSAFKMTFYERGDYAGVTYQIQTSGDPQSVPSITDPPDILSNYSVVSSEGYLDIAGEVQNNTANHLSLVKIAANFFSSSGRLLDTDYTYIQLDNLPASDKTCFHISLEEPLGWAHYEFESPTCYVSGGPLPDLIVLNDSGSYDSYYGWYKIIGQVRNDHSTRVEYVNPVGTLYSASGTVMGCGSTFVNSTHLDPGQTSSFEMNFYSRDYAAVALYRVQVDGDLQLNGYHDYPAPH
jgi:hypothetical protein